MCDIKITDIRHYENKRNIFQKTQYTENNRKQDIKISYHVSYL